MRKTMILMLGLLFLGAGCLGPECIRSHYELRHRNAWMQPIWTGKAMMSVYHPAYDYNAEVCDEYASD